MLISVRSPAIPLVVNCSNHELLQGSCSLTATHFSAAVHSQPEITIIGHKKESLIHAVARKIINLLCLFVSVINWIFESVTPYGRDSYLEWTTAIIKI